MGSGVRESKVQSAKQPNSRQRHACGLEVTSSAEHAVNGAVNASRGGKVIKTGSVTALFQGTPSEEERCVQNKR